MQTKNLIVKCPSCSKQVKWEPSEEFRPFCSERCQQIDLGAWASEEYAIPAPPDEVWSEEDILSEVSPTKTLQ